MDLAINSKKPIINAINGIAAGGGVGLALCGDIVIASEKAKFKLVFGPQLGIIPDVGASWLVPNLIGRAKANGLALLGDDLDAKQAYEWGLIWQVVKNEDLLSEATKIAIRNIRRDGIEQVKKLEKDKEIGQDDSKKFQEKIICLNYTRLNAGLMLRIQILIYLHQERSLNIMLQVALESEWTHIYIRIIRSLLIMILL